MLCDADVAAGCTLEPFVVCSLCTVTRRFEAAGRSFQQTYERRDSLKHPRKSGSSELSCLIIYGRRPVLYTVRFFLHALKECFRGDAAACRKHPDT